MKKEKTKIILTGYRATGKTTIGKLLAKRLDFSFVDIDQEIENKEGRTIAAMVTEHGWPYFRERERDFLQSLISRENLVIAPGGGAVLHRDAWQQLMESSLIIWLQADVRTIGQRLAADGATAGQRPSLTGGDILAEIDKVLQEREPLYQAGSHYAMQADRDPERLVDAIVALWRENEEAGSGKRRISAAGEN